MALIDLDAPSGGLIDLDTYEPPVKKDEGDLGRGFKESFQQLPQLGYGLLAGAGAAAESAFGEGGISTGIKKAGVKGYQEWGDKIAADAKESDSFTYSYDKAKEGDFGAMVDWLQHGLGYAGGQALQMLATAGIGSVVGKASAKVIAEELAGKLVAKEAARIAATEQGAKLASEQVAKIATANVASKIGQTAAIGAAAYGMEGGEIFGDLAKRSVDEGRALSGEELAKAFGATLAAGSLEFVGDKVGLDIMLGKSALLKPAAAMQGVAGRAARGGIAAAGAAPIEGATEYGQTLIEEYGKSNDPFSAESEKNAIDAAALGAIGGAAMGGVGGAVRGPQTQNETAAPQEEQQPPLLLENNPDPLIAFPDGTVGRRADVENFIAGLPEDQQIAARARLLGFGEQQADQPEATIAYIGINNPEVTADDAIAAAEASVFGTEQQRKNDEIDAAWKAYAQNLSLQREQEFALAEQARRDADVQAMQQQVADQQVEQANALTQAQGFDTQEPTAMQLAMQRALERRKQMLTPVSQRSQTAVQLQETKQGGANESISSQANVRQNPAIGPDVRSELAQETADSGNTERPQGDIPQSGSVPTETERPVAEVTPQSAQNIPSAPPVPPAQPALVAQSAEVARAKQALTDAGVTGVERTNTIAAVRRGELTAEDVIEAHPAKAAPVEAEPQPMPEPQAITEPAPTEQPEAPEPLQSRSISNQGPTSLDEVRNTWKSEGVIGSVHESKNVISLSKIVVAKSKRGSGSGTAAMRELIAYADRTGKRIVLSPSIDFGGSSVSRLKEFYKRLGFVENKGSAKDFSVSESMYRDPKQETVPLKSVAPGLSENQNKRVAKAWTELAKNSDLFRYPKSGSKDMLEIFSTAAPDIMIEPNNRAMPDDMEKAWNIYPKDAQGNAIKSRNGWVLQYKDGKVEINVANFATGDTGSQVYAAVGNYAYNNDLLFAGDRFGVSEDAMFRRLENLTSLALKFNSTDFIALHPDQIARFGIVWKDGDTEHNIGEMLKASFDEVAKVYPEIRELAYDFDTSEFKDISSGLEFDERGIERISERARAAGFRGGRNTLKRAALTNTILQGNESGEVRFTYPRDREFGGKPLDKALVGVAYSKSERRTSGLTAEQVQKSITRLRAKWAGFTRVNVVQSVADLPQELADRLKPDARTEGFYDEATNSVYLIADNIASTKRGVWVAAHEVIGHGGLRMLKDKTINGALNLAGANRFIRDLANAINTDRGGKVADDIALQESIAEYAAAIETDDMQALQDRYGVKVPLSAQNGIKAVLARLFDAIKRFIATVTGNPAEDVSDAEVRGLIMAQRRAVEGKPSDDLRAEFDKIEAGFNAVQALSSSATNPGMSESSAPDSVGAPLQSRSQILGDSKRQYTPEQLREFKHVGRTVEVPTLKERMASLWQDAGKKLAQGIADQFAPIKDIDKEAYALLRLSKGAGGAFEVMLRGGQLKLDGGVYDFDDTKRGGVIDRLLKPLKGEMDDFLWWVAANRAEKLSQEDREHLFSAQSIAAIKTLDAGVAEFDYTLQHGPRAGQVTRDRTLIYRDAMRTFNEFNKNTLDMAEQSGLIDGSARQYWESEFYVPFYRVDEESGVRGANVKSGVVRQQAFKTLKGGTGKLNSDLLENTLMNWAHLIDAAAKNRAAKASLEAAQRVGVAIEAPESTVRQMAKSIGQRNNVVWFMDQGKERYFLVDDPYILTAIQGLEYAGMKGPLMDALGAMKHVLTVGVTASPFFKIRNLIRDSVQAIGASPLSYNVASNVKEGWKLTDRKGDAYFRLLAGGGTIHFGTMLEGSETKRVRSLVNSGVDAGTVLDSEQKYKAFYKRYIEPSITAYNELGNRGEAINRASLYDQLRRQGKSHAEASLMARDLMDFSMGGAWTGIRFLAQVVPFMNARIQGLYKLGRAAKEDPARFANVLGAVAVTSVALMLAYSDDDDWKKREDWDRDNFWWFKVGGVAFRIPKPFEIGAIGTLAERGVEYFSSKEMTGERFRKRLYALLSDNLAMNPTPQLVKPILDIYANKDSFSGRPIETMGMERLMPEYRFTERTSMAARGISTAGNTVTGAIGLEFASPMQIDHMIRGYFGWLGAFAVGSADMIARPTTGQADKPTPDYWKVATGGMVSDLEGASSRYVSQMYEQAKVLEEAYGTHRMLLKTGKADEARKFAEDNMDKLRKYRAVEAVKRAESKFNERIRMIERSDKPSDEKRDLIRAIQRQKDAIARQLSV